MRKSTKKTKKSNGEALTKTKADVPALSDMFEEDAGVGFEGIGADDMAIPFIAILQKGSPQVDPDSGSFVDGAKPGMIYNTVTNDIYDGKVGIKVLKCGFKKSYVEWMPRDSGGGLVGHHLEGDPVIEQCTVNERGQRITPDGNLLQDTHYHFVLLLPDDGVPEWAIIAMASTQMKVSRNWHSAMSKIRFRNANGDLFQPPSWSHTYNMTTTPQSKDKYTWFGWSVENVGPVTDQELYVLGKEFAHQVADDKVRISAPPQQDYSEKTEGNQVGDDMVPF